MTLAALFLIAAAHSCPPDLSAWRQLLGAEWIDCHQIGDLSR
jgi:hypothetical protein